MSDLSLCTDFIKLVDLEVFLFVFFFFLVNADFPLINQNAPSKQHSDPNLGDLGLAQRPDHMYEPTYLSDHKPEALALVARSQQLPHNMVIGHNRGNTTVG